MSDSEHDANVAALKLCLAFRAAMDDADPLDGIVAALNRAAGPDAQAAQRAIEQQWHQLHERREQRDAQLAPAREYGWQQYEQARAASGMAASAPGPRMSFDRRWWR